MEEKFIKDFHKLIPKLRKGTQKEVRTIPINFSSVSTCVIIICAIGIGGYYFGYNRGKKKLLTIVNDLSDRVLKLEN